MSNLEDCVKPIVGPWIGGGVSQIDARTSETVEFRGQSGIDSGRYFQIATPDGIPLLPHHNSPHARSHRVTGAAETCAFDIVADTAAGAATQRESNEISLFCPILTV